MRVLFFITKADSIGGAQLYVRDLARYLIQAGHNVLVVTGVKGLYTVALERYGVPSVQCISLKNQINLVQDWQTLAFFKQTIHKFQPDLVSTHSSKAGVLGRLACKVTRTSCIFTAHGWAFTDGVPEPSRTVYQRLEQLAEPWADRIICVSENDRQIAIQAGMKPNRLLTIHNGVLDIPQAFRANPSVSNPVRIAMIARFDQQKDQGTLIKAIQDVPGVQLDLVGEGSRLEAMKTLVTQLRMTQQVNFWGYRDNVAEILAQVQIFALISNWEGFPLVTLEAMRAGLPVVISDVGGAAEAVVEGVTGYCIPRGNVDVLRERLVRLVSNAALRTQMGHSGRQRFETEFTFERMFNRTLEVYEQVLANKRKQ